MTKIVSSIESRCFLLYSIFHHIWLSWKWLNLLFVKCSKTDNSHDHSLLAAKAMLDVVHGSGNSFSPLLFSPFQLSLDFVEEKKVNQTNLKEFPLNGT